MTSLVPGGVNTNPINSQPIVFGATNPYMTAPAPGGAAAPNPYGSAVPGASQTPMTSTVPNPGSSIPQPSVPLSGSGGLNGPYGGLAPAIQQLLGSQGGYNPQAVAAIIAQMQPQIAKGQQNVAEEFGAAGGRFSSAAATGLADYNSQVQLNEGDIMAKMYMESYQNYMDAVLGVGGQVEGYEASRPTAWDVIGGLLGDATSAFGAYEGAQ